MFHKQGFLASEYHAYECLIHIKPTQDACKQLENRRIENMRYFQRNRSSGSASN